MTKSTEGDVSQITGAGHRGTTAFSKRVLKGRKKKKAARKARRNNR